MLNKSTLQKQLQQGFEDILPGAFEQALQATFPRKTEIGDKQAKEFGKVVSDLISEPLTKVIASAIDYYVRNISISGTIITVGSPTTQTAMINSPSPITNGKVPNSLGIN